MKKDFSRKTKGLEFEALSTLVPGQEVGDYILDSYIGCGKIGHVYKAHRKEIPEIVQAVKLVHELKDGWETEIKKVALLRKVQNVVQFHHLGTAIVKPANLQR